MDIKSASEHIQSLQEPFDVILIKNGIEKTYDRLAPTNVEGFLNELIDKFNPDKLFIQERKKSGNALLRGVKHELNVGGFVSQIPALSGFSGQTPNNISLPPDFKDYMIQDLKEKVKRFESKTDKLEAENEALKRQNFELEKEQRFKDKEFELLTKSKELEQVNGLSGVLDKVANNPMLANLAFTAIGRLMGIDPAGLPDSGEEASQSAHDNLQGVPELNQKIAAQVSNWIHTADESTVKAFYKLAQEISKDTSLLAELLSLVNSQTEESHE